jgi:hypothetical protein
MEKKIDTGKQIEEILQEMTTHGYEGTMDALRNLIAIDRKRIAREFFWHSADYLLRKNDPELKFRRKMLRSVFNSIAKTKKQKGIF